MDDLKPILDALSGAGGVGLIAYGILSKIKKEWDDTKSLLSTALNKISSIEQDRGRCNKAHSDALNELFELTRSQGERIAKLEAKLENHQQSQIIGREATKWNN